jgi:hypothetical protein
MRVLSGVGGAVIMLLSAIVSAGAALVAPIGMAVMRRRAQRRGRPLTRFASWLGAVIASSIAATLLMGALLSFMPADSLQEMQRATAEARARDTVPVAAWMSKTFPQTAASDSVAKRVAGTRGFLVVTLVIGVGGFGLFLGTLGGSGGWLGSTLLAFAFRRGGLAMMICVAALACGAPAHQACDPRFLGTWEYRQAAGAGFDAEGERLVISCDAGSPHGLYYGLERAGEHGLFYTRLEMMNVAMTADSGLSFMVGERQLYSDSTRATWAGVTRDTLVMRGRLEGANLAVTCTSTAYLCPDKVMVFHKDAW